MLFYVPMDIIFYFAVVIEVMFLIIYTMWDLAGGIRRTKFSLNSQHVIGTIEKNYILVGYFGKCQKTHCHLYDISTFVTHK